MLFTNKKKIKSFVILISFLGIIACATKPTHLFYEELDIGIQALSQPLFKGIQTDLGLLGRLHKTLVVIEPFKLIPEQTKGLLNQRIEQVLLKEGQKILSSSVHLAIMTPENLSKAQYVLTGVIDFSHPKTLESTDKPAGDYFHVAATVTNNTRYETVAQSEAWLSGQNLDHTKPLGYQESPMYIKDESQSGQQAQQKGYEAVSTDDLLTQAEKAYENEDYPTAARLFNLAAERYDGRIMRTYAGLYETYLKLEDTQAAEETFHHLLAVSIKENNKLNLKLLFSAHSIEFINDEALREQYTRWLKQIGDYFSQTNLCIQIEGHSSRTEDFQLALTRAQRVEKLIRVNAPALLYKLKAVGKGAKENVVGSSSNDLRNAIDRRVEFIIVDCSQI